MQTSETPAARSTDPCTSHEAADAITESGDRVTKRQKVLDALIRHGQNGITSDELAEVSGLPYGTVERRLSELRQQPMGAFVRGYPESPERRKNPHTGRSAMVWRPVETKVEIG
ncbi:MAG: winged helix-turn-helix domain-containing protein [Salinirussus sp.]